MVTASVLALEELTPDWTRPPTRRELQEGFDVWLDNLEETANEEPTRLDALTRAVLGRRQELTVPVTKFLVRKHRAQAMEQKNVLCRHCGRLLPAHGLVSRTVETPVGEVTLAQPYFYCLECKQGFYPLDEALELADAGSSGTFRRPGPGWLPRSLLRQPRNCSRSLRDFP